MLLYHLFSFKNLFQEFFVLFLLLFFKRRPEGIYNALVNNEMSHIPQALSNNMFT